jgi:UDP-N-acetylglucosamine--N-acetylmuramyl-(pentapeptide) pyrophosphoryl-undecaprenol N-acetylglucosamine transferase
VRVVITGGGTGGHLFPALAVREALVARLPDAETLFVGSASGVEAAILPRRGYAFRGLAAAKVKGAGAAGRLRAALGLPRTVHQAGRILKEFRPDVVFGVGGYASFPTVLAAGLRRIPVVLHEQNAIPGLANRTLGRLASRVAVSFGASARFFPAGRTSVTGNPVRADIRPGDPRPARQLMGLSADRFTVFVFGGSQGAHRLNLAAAEALPLLGELRDRVQFIHAAGPREFEDVRRAYGDAQVAARVEAFFEDIARCYQAADFVISRSGAGTVFELAAVGKPALLVPFPHAANDHQRANAEALVEAGAAWILLDPLCDGRRIAAAIHAAQEKPAQRLEMGRKAQTLARPDAADRIVDLLRQAARAA